MSHRRLLEGGSTKEIHRASRPKPTKLFRFYALNLGVRAALLVAAVFALAFAPEQLSIAQGFGFAHGVTLIDVIFLLLVVDGLTKFFPNAKIAVGSLKQFGQYHVPTLKLLRDNPHQLRSALRERLSNRRAFVEGLPAQARVFWNETREGVLDTLKVLLSDFSFLQRLPIKRDSLVATNPVRARIKADRIREIAPVIIFWVLFNMAVAVLLSAFDVLTEPILIIWMLVYFLFDMICIVLWCPLQLLFMKNRCCTTCPIFNWDAAMTVTPLLLMAGSLTRAPFTWPLLLLAFVVLVRWEFTFARHPERFDERTNASLSCANCHDKLCYIREPLKARLQVPELEKLASSAAELDALLSPLAPSQPAPSSPTQPKAS